MYLWRLWRCRQRGGWPLLKRMAAVRTHVVAARDFRGRIYQSPWEQVPYSNRRWQLDWARFESPVPDPPRLRLPSRQLLVGLATALLAVLMPWKLLLAVPFLFGSVFDPEPTLGVPKWAELTSPFGPYSQTFFAGSSKYTGTVEARITACNADAAAAAAAAGRPTFTFVPGPMLGYNPAFVTFNTSVRMTCEGANPTAFDVRAYGAAGLGDDTLAFQAALNGAATVPNGRVEVVAGTWTTGELHTASNVTLAGTGWHSILKAKAVSTDGSLVRNTGIDQTAYNGGSNITIRDLTLDANNDAMTGGARWVCIGMAHVQGLRILDCQLLNPGYHCVDMPGCSDVLIEGCRLYNGSATLSQGMIQVDSCESGSLASASAPFLNADATICQHIKIIGNHIEGAVNGPGIHLHKRGAKYVTISGNTVTNCVSSVQDDGDGTFPGVLYLTITGNSFALPRATGHGISITNGASTDVTITGNVLLGADLHGIVVGFTSPNANNNRVTVSGNSVDNANRSPIRLDGCDDFAVASNTLGACAGTGFAGIEIRNTATGGSITCNVINANSVNNDGVSVGNVGAQSKVTITGNRIRSPRDGVVVTGNFADFVIANNQLYNAAQFNIHVEGTGAGTRLTDFTIAGNQINCASAGQHAIRVRLCQRGAVTGNQIRLLAASQTAISLSDAPDCTAMGNTIDGNSAASTAGIGITTSGDCTVVGNRISNCATGVNIGAAGANNNVVRANRISCTTGVAIVASCNDNQVADNVLIGCTTFISDSGTRTDKRGNKFSAGARSGTAVMVAGTVTVSTAEIQTGDSVLLTNVTVGGTVGTLSKGTIVNGTSVVINSSSGTDTSTVYWEIVH